MLPPLPPAWSGHCDGRRIEPVLAGEAGATILRLTDAAGEVAYLKYGTGAVARDIADEIARLRWLAGRVPCARLIEAALTDDAAWLLTAAVPGLTGDEWLEREPAALPRVIDGAAQILRRLHALPTRDCPFDAGAALRLAAAERNVAEGVVDCGDFDDDHAGWTAEAVLARAVALAPVGGQRVVTHGDFSLGNIVFDRAGAAVALIDVGRLGVADPYQDLTILWQNLAEFGPAAQDRWLAACGVDRVDHDRLHFHRLLDELF